MIKKFFGICAFILCTAMLSGCNANESGSKTEPVSNSETTISAENASETTQTEVDTETTTEETEPKVQISYRKIREINYPSEGDSYVAKKYEYKDDCCYKETIYRPNGNLAACFEYKNNIIVKAEFDSIGLSTEYDGTKMENIIKITNYKGDQKKDETVYDYQFNDDFTEAYVTASSILYYETDYNPEPLTYVFKYEYDEKGNIIHKYNYHTNDPDTIYNDIYYEYDDNGNITKKKNIDTSYVIYEYDEYNRQIGWTDYDADGNETSHAVVEYE